MLHSHSASICLLEKWAARYSWVHIGPRSFRAFVAPSLGWMLSQWSTAFALLSAERAAEAWNAAIRNRDDYAATHGGYTREGFPIPGEVAAAARGE